MDSAASDPAGTAPARARHLAATVKRSVKVLVVGPFGVGKTTLIQSVSEIPVLSTEESITTASVGVDRRTGEKSTTTVAMDFGRVTVGGDTALYLFGTPGQRRFWDLWSGLADGAVGVLVLVDTRNLADSFEVLDQLEDHTRLPLTVVVNEFPGAPRHSVEEVRTALDLPAGTPVVSGDVRGRPRAVQALTTLVAHALEQRARQAAAA
ncbi:MULTISPECIES: ATP/GTP-binding protein [Isoptericola]|uniref:ATP-binding protein n=1 Tax=Isoptericola sediminis TaxID=2733572 RepID=A0A849K1U7_9MICO|nr:MULTISPECIES: ATP/GTP-binding protein [Isoptericola]MDO8146819.1 ATP/GTP-binding protein [Isoptericola sp. b515]MDO8150867.1 ATP/GTP-binding protein [Isoptericola sp. b408]NNU26039.1 ATP-binding protein [Isoptericola sediminis]